MKQIVVTDKAPGAIGPYSQAVVSAGSKFVFVSGQIPLDPKSGAAIPGGIVEQTTQVLENLKAVLEAAGSHMSKVVKTTVLMQDLAQFTDMNDVYATYFSSNPPARAAFQVARLPKNVLIEIEAIAEV